MAPDMRTVSCIRPRITLSIREGGGSSGGQGGVDLLAGEVSRRLGPWRYLHRQPHPLDGG